MTDELTPEEIEEIQIEEEKQRKALVINRVGANIRRLKDEKKITGKAFIDFRNEIYAMPEEDREQFVLDKMKEHGLDG